MQLLFKEGGWSEELEAQTPGEPQSSSSDEDAVYRVAVMADGGGDNNRGGYSFLFFYIWEARPAPAECAGAGAGGSWRKAGILAGEHGQGKTLPVQKQRLKY